MKNTSCNSKHNKKAFTLIELLIVIAIIGILFIVLVSRVDFATDKAKATGVQTDFRSFQVALDQVAKENAGFNIFGWDTGDANGDRIRNSYDRGDTNQNGIEDAGETLIGRKEYGEAWTTFYTMINPDTTKPNDTSAFVALEAAINANLDPKLHITITPDVDGGALTGNATITMANQARDPWKNEYHGVFITNAARDNGADRGAIIIYSDGANGKWGSAHDITNGVVSVTVPNNNKNGQDDYSIVSCYTYTNGYGEVKNLTTGFSTNHSFLNGGSSTGVQVGGNNGGGNVLNPGNGNNNEPNTPIEPISYDMLDGDNQIVATVQDVVFRSAANYGKFVSVKVNGSVIDSNNYTVKEGSTIVTLKAAYVATLQNGQYIIEIVSNDGSAQADFTLNKNEREDVYELKGTWLINNTLTHPSVSEINQEITFTILNYYGSYELDRSYFSLIVDEFNNFIVSTGGPLLYALEGGEILYFGEEPQEVSKEFYEWFTKNATEQHM